MSDVQMFPIVCDDPRHEERYGQEGHADVLGETDTPGLDGHRCQACALASASDAEAELAARDARQQARRSAQQGLYRRLAESGHISAEEAELLLEEIG